MKSCLTTIPILVLFAFSLSSCKDAKIAAIGEEDEIIVFADSLTWYAFGPSLRAVFHDTIYTPQPEMWFTLRRIPFTQFTEYEKHKNRLIVGTLDEEGPVSAYISGSLDPAVRELVKEGREYVFTKYDTRARGQILMYLTGPDISSLQASIGGNAANLLYFFKNMSLKREMASLASESAYNKREIEDRLKKQYGWSMTVQHDYWVAIDSASSHFFWMRRANPSDMERWIFVHWIDQVDPGTLTDEFVMHLRDSLTRQFMRTMDDDAHVEIAPYHLQIQTVNFLGRFAYEMRGNWRFSDKSGGGPFVSYTFYDEETRRIYMVDGSIFAPRVEKKKLILQVDGLLHTFQPSSNASAPQ